MAAMYYRIGLDIGSTTIKAIVLSPDEKIVFSHYERHNVRIKEKLGDVLIEIHKCLGNVPTTLCFTGSVGMGVAERYALPFIQEVVAATHYIRHQQNDISTLIDIGGEDAKIIFFKNGEATDLRMNGNCAGGTGAFIDQMSVLLNCSVEDMSKLALDAKQIYPIASRCGVFSKTDVQNLIAKNITPSDIAASIFHAVAVQVVVTLAHGCEIQAPLLFCGGPLTFLPALRKAFIDYLHLDEENIVLPENSLLLPAWGAALAANGKIITDLCQWIKNTFSNPFDGLTIKHTLEPIFQDNDEYERWRKRMLQQDIETGTLQTGLEKVTLGIDSGSTTTKIVALNEKEELVFSFYCNNNGNPITAVERGLKIFQDQCLASGTEIQVVGSCATGYGEDLIKAAFHLDEVPVLSLTFGSNLKNEQSGFKMNWFKMLPVVLDALLYSDCIAKLYYASAVREKEKGAAARLKEMYLNAAQSLIEREMHGDLLSYLYIAAKDFEQITETCNLPKIGIVGEIYLKFNPFAQKDISEWLVSRKLEVVPPLLTEFFVQGFINYAVKQDSKLRRKLVPDVLIRWLYNRVWERMKRFNRACDGFRYFTPFRNVFDESEEASKVISLNAQFGEGWSCLPKYSRFPNKASIT